MRPPELATAIPGSGAVHEWFGRWPSFHDAEIVSIRLARSGPSTIQVYPYSPERPATVEFVLDEITDLKLEDFSQQNVIGGLSVGPALMPDGQDGFRLRIFSLFGIGGHIDARRIRMNLIPGASTDGFSQW